MNKKLTSLLFIASSIIASSEPKPSTQEVKKIVETQEREITVHRIPPPSEAERKILSKKKRKVETRKMVADPRPTKSFMIKAMVCEDQTTYLEWHSVDGEQKPVYQAFSSICWHDLEALQKLESGSANYIFFNFVSKTTKAELVKQGKLSETAEPNLNITAQSSVYQVLSQAAHDESAMQFMNDLHQYHAMNQELLRRDSAQVAAAKNKGEPIGKKKSTITYWRKK